MAGFSVVDTVTQARSGGFIESKVYRTWHKPLPLDVQGLFFGQELPSPQALYLCFWVPSTLPPVPVNHPPVPVIPFHVCMALE